MVGMGKGSGIGLGAVLAGLAFAAVALHAAPAYGWIIVQVIPEPGAGYGEAVITQFDKRPDTDRLQIDKFYMGELPQNQTRFVLKFTREPNDAGIVKLQIVDEMILNLTTFNWNGYRIGLEFDPNGDGGGDDDSVKFIDPNAARAWQQTGGATRLDGTPDLATNTAIEWGTTIPSQIVPTGTFDDVPVNQLVLRKINIDVSKLEQGDWFQIVQWPVPEPGTVSLLTLGGLAVMCRGRRK
jgi:hypothetical protein